MGQIVVKWTGDDSRLFVGRDSGGRTVTVGYWQRGNEPEWIEWRAVKASDLLVIALCACSGYDVVDILQKQRVQLAGLMVIAEAEQAPEPPWPFVRIHLHYVVSGPNLDPQKVERAIKLSEEKYCSVAATIRGVTQITHDFEIRA
ncbi:MAG: OsmC family protein [Anaerolineae bacterium]